MVITMKMNINDILYETCMINENGHYQFDEYDFDWNDTEIFDEYCDEYFDDDGFTADDFHYDNGKDINEAVARLANMMSSPDAHVPDYGGFHAAFGYHFIMSMDGNDITEKCYNALIEYHMPEFEPSFLDTIDSLRNDG